VISAETVLVAARHRSLSVGTYLGTRSIRGQAMRRFVKIGTKFLASVAILGLAGTAGSVRAAPVTDIVFLIDASASMGDNIADVRAGFATFVSNLNAQGVDARFAIVMFGGEPELIQTSPATQWPPRPS
jgi:hypothetical protein